MLIINKSNYIHEEGNRLISKEIQINFEGVSSCAQANPSNAYSPILKTPILHLLNYFWCRELIHVGEFRGGGDVGWIPWLSKPRQPPRWPSSLPQQRRGLPWKFWLEKDFFGAQRCMICCVSPESSIVATCELRRSSGGIRTKEVILT